MSKMDTIVVIRPMFVRHQLHVDQTRSIWESALIYLPAFLPITGLLAAISAQNTHNATNRNRVVLPAIFKFFGFGFGSLAEST